MNSESAYRDLQLDCLWFIQLAISPMRVAVPNCRSGGDRSFEGPLHFQCFVSILNFFIGLISGNSPMDGGSDESDSGN